MRKFRAKSSVAVKCRLITYACSLEIWLRVKWPRVITMVCNLSRCSWPDPEKPASPEEKKARKAGQAQKKLEPRPRNTSQPRRKSGVQPQKYRPAQMKRRGPDPGAAARPDEAQGSDPGACGQTRRRPWPRLRLTHQISRKPC